ncbi:glycosyl transferase family 1 [Pedobacter chinensis]|uniref:Glycosyl transferase family 1 n=1 Tax=Pedobacter chinensis TaxID=2282421 RepID=A0A369PNX8_9SPHI|nr:glycosyl transferase family 1 [Pedobacter chinensis]RDC54244.1 glycosyl transferase family 1 [Pedobacter chinensis]
MKDELLFLAEYPNETNIKDGMISRIKAIDQIFEDVPRIYLTVSLRRNIKMYQQKVGKIELYKLNLFMHFFKIVRLIINSKTIYSHSIHMSKFLYILFPFFKGNLILDAHGVVPEEELLFQKKKLASLLMSIVEKVVFSYAKYVICVSKAMENHFKRKYKKFKGKYIIYSILPENLLQKQLESRREPQKEINVIYSGGISPWQNISLMLKTIENNQTPHIKYTILTGDLLGLKQELKKFKIEPAYLNVLSVLPSELDKFYQQADYAFILRDDIIVNNVANPTKMVEYLYYGIIPIVLSPKIGDYFELGYDYFSINEFNTDLLKPEQPSVKNMLVVKQLFEQNKVIDLKKEILNYN